VWEVEVTDQFLAWLDGLDTDRADAVIEAIDALEVGGPGLGRPFVDTVKGSRHSNMKELRPRGSHLRVLFALDPRRHAIVLLGGDKRGRWQAWYREAIPAADALYDEHLDLLREEGLL
jgi:hypothetical protein